MSGLVERTPEEIRRWGRHAHGSPLYAHLIEVIADDDELMRVVNRIEHTPRPNVLFGGVQYLLMGGASAELAAFYPSLVDEPRPLVGVDRVFTRFVLEQEEALVEIGQTRYTQTNECRRCVALLPGIWESGPERFHLIDLGTSAGLNLAVDRYQYRWGDVEWGHPSGLLLTAESRGRAPEPKDTEVLSRTGLDLNPIDVSDEAERRWLDALIWPEHHERRSRLRAALEVISNVDVSMVAGSALDTLGPTLAALPAGDPAVVMHSFALNQFSPDQRHKVAATIDEARDARRVHRVSYEFIDKEDDWARLSVDFGDGLVDVGQGHPHGEWVELYARP